jgi:hypothetical protein
LCIRDKADASGIALWELRRGDIICVSEIHERWAKVVVDIGADNLGSVIGWVLLQNKKEQLLRKVEATYEARSSWATVRTRAADELLLLNLSPLTAVSASAVDLSGASRDEIKLRTSKESNERPVSGKVTYDFQALLAAEEKRIADNGDPYVPKERRIAKVEKNEVTPDAEVGVGSTQTYVVKCILCKLLQ